MAKRNAYIYIYIYITDSPVPSSWLSRVSPVACVTSNTVSLWLCLMTSWRHGGGWRINSGPRRTLSHCCARDTQTGADTHNVVRTLTMRPRRLRMAHSVGIFSPQKNCSLGRISHCRFKDSATKQELKVVHSETDKYSSFGNVFSCYVSL